MINNDHIIIIIIPIVLRDGVKKDGKMSLPHVCCRISRSIIKTGDGALQHEIETFINRDRVAIRRVMCLAHCVFLYTEY
jgi:hypothetical protein